MCLSKTVKGDPIHIPQIHISVVSLFPFFSLSVSHITYTAMSQCLSAHAVIQSLPKFLPALPHILAVLPACIVPQVPLSESTFPLLLLFFPSANLLGLPIYQVFPPLIIPTHIIKFRNSLKRWEWEGSNGYKRLDCFTLKR